MMTEEELKRFRNYANHYQGSDVFFLMEHIDEQAKQIAKLTEEADCTEIYEALEDVGIPMGDGEQPQDIITAMGILGRQVATLKAALIEERARALWFNGTDPSNAPNLDWKTPPNDISKSVRWLWEVPAKKQLAKEYPEIFTGNNRLQEIERFYQSSRELGDRKKYKT